MFYNYSVYYTMCSIEQLWSLIVYFMRVNRTE